MNHVTTVANIRSGHFCCAAAPSPSLILARAEGMELVELVLLYVRYNAVLVWPTAAFTERAAFVETCDRFMKRAASQDGGRGVRLKT